jgi:hypothetical protein
MNIFEDLVDELKKENLLEETVVETSHVESETETYDEEIIEAQTFLENYTQEQNSSAEQFPLELGKDFDLTNETAVSNGNFIYNQPLVNAEKPKSSVNEAELYRKRAVDEVSGLQIVEHILSGVEREQMNIVSKPYDDLEVKKSLHSFLQVSKNVKSPEHAQAEFQLMQETESWYSALSYRDKHISVAHLRRYCETTRPALSSQALIALARFYRNSPYSESVRSKFDLVVTRLFSKETDNEKREISVLQAELIKSLTQLYAEWESVSVYANEQNDSKNLITTLKFEDFMAEADSADSFDELVRNDFFNRLRVFKESTLEQFFVPLVTATAIESNVKIGNRYIELLEIEVKKGGAEKLENKYGFLHDQVISDATSKTLQLVELLKTKGEIYKPFKKSEVAEKKNGTEKIQLSPTVRSVEGTPKQKQQTWYSVNKWLLAATILVVVSSIALFVWASQTAAPEKISQNVKVVNLENSFLKEYIKDARINKESFYAIVLPNWDDLKREKKEDVLKKILATGTNKGFKNVYLLNQQGKAVGSASGERVETY